MKIIDLTHTVHRSIPVFPGDDPVQLDHIKTLGRDGFNDFRLTTGMHVGTHVDGPKHMTADPHLIGQIPLEQFAGKGVLIDVRGEGQIDFKQSFGTLVQPGDIVLLFSGIATFFGTSNYFTDYPNITEGLANFLVQQKVKMIGIDWPSPDHESNLVHNILLKSNILILENLTNLIQLLNVPNFEIFAFPLKLETDSSLVRAVAVIDSCFSSDQ